MKSMIEIYYSLFSSTIEMMAFFDWRSDRSSPHFSDKKKIEKLIHSLLTISGTISLSFQSTFLLSFTLLVHYRFPKCQYSVLQGTYLVLETILPNSPTLLLLVSWWPDSLTWWQDYHLVSYLFPQYQLIMCCQPPILQQPTILNYNSKPSLKTSSISILHCSSFSLAVTQEIVVTFFSTT